jgi:hypothetical protein
VIQTLLQAAYGKKYLYEWSTIASWCNIHEVKYFGCITFHCRVMMLCHTYTCTHDDM